MKINFHKFSIADTEEPDIYAAGPLLKWQQTDQGRWVMEHAHDLRYHYQPDPYHWGYEFVIRGEITDSRRLTEYFLRWPNQDES